MSEPSQYKVVAVDYLRITLGSLLDLIYSVFDIIMQLWELFYWQWQTILHLMLSLLFQ